MVNEFRRRSLESLKKEAKRWLADTRANAGEARDRLARALSHLPESPSLRDVQLALAREHGFAGWSALKESLAKTPDASTATLDQYEGMADALLAAYRTGTPDAMERHHRFTWHRREWRAMRTYVQLDLGKRPTKPDDDVEITLDDARHLVALEHGFENWDALHSFIVALPARASVLANPMSVHRASAPDVARLVDRSREWQEVLSLLKGMPDAVLEANGQMQDSMLRDLSGLESLTSLNLSGSRAVSDTGLRHLARMPNLRHLDLGGTSVTDRGLEIVRELPALESISLAMTHVTDGGVAHLGACARLKSVNLTGTSAGDGAIRALAGKAGLDRFRSGNAVTDAGLAMLHEWPVFKTWRGGEPRMALLSYDAGPNYLCLRGPFTDRGMHQLRGLDGLFALNLDARELGITAAALAPLVTLPNLGWLAVDAKDDWMPYIAEMPRLRFLGAQDTVAGDDGFVALGRSTSIEYIWGRRCHNLRRRGFLALSAMPALRGLSVSCLNVDDAGISALPQFPALRELMPMDVPDAGYRHIGRCATLESLVLMYCRDTTDTATEHITGLSRLTDYFNSYTTITDRTPELLSTMNSLERITFSACHGLTDAGVAPLARLPNLRELHVSGKGITVGLDALFPASVAVHRD